MTDLIQRRFPFVHVEIRDHNELADVLKKRVPAIVLPSSPSETATVVDSKHYSMVLRVRSTHDVKHPTVKGVRHLMIIGAVAWANVVKAIALHDPIYDFYTTANDGLEKPLPQTLSYGVQLLETCGTTSSREHRHMELCQPIFNYWWSEYQKVWIIRTVDPTLAKKLSMRLRKDRWTTSSDFWSALKELFVHGEMKHKLGLMEEAYQHWREVVNLHHIMSATKSWKDQKRTIATGDKDRISDMMRTLNSECSSLCLAFASDSDSAKEKSHYAEQALRHCVSTNVWVRPPYSGALTEVRRGIYKDMLKAYSLSLIHI